MASRLHSQERRRQLAKLAEASAWSMLFVAAGVIVGGLVLTGRSVQIPGGIPCLECKAQWEAYHAHLTKKTDFETTLAQQVKDHLAQCPMCRDMFEKQYPGVLVHTVGHVTPRLNFYNSWLLATKSP